jgi:hypothetical protein
MPVRLLDEAVAVEMAMLRETCDAALAHTAAASGIGSEAFLLHEETWPVRRSEVMALAADPYRGEIPPLGWRGFGAQPLLHVDAR